MANGEEVEGAVDSDADAGIRLQTAIESARAQCRNVRIMGAWSPSATEGGRYDNRFWPVVLSEI
jgi:hypothetical protein